MRVLLIGSGGREHALAFAMNRSPQLKALFIAPGNGGTAALGENASLDIADHGAVINFCRLMAIDLVVIGPEGPLVAGLVDDLEAAGLTAFGPSREAARLEGSKAFTKALCDEMGIPTAAYARFTAEKPALDYVRTMGAPIVVKADGLAAGKGVTVAMTVVEAEAAVGECFSGAFGSAGAEIVIEEFLEGEEVSLFALCDGEAFVLLPGVQDHKRAFDGDKGPNTGGMGAYSPPPVLTETVLEQARREIIEPTVRGLATRGTPFKGVLFAGLMITAGGPKLIEYNVRFGDPECQVLMMRLRSDVLALLHAAARGRLGDVVPVWAREAALCVIMAAKGYPGPYLGGDVIRGTEGLDSEDVQVFHAGTRREGKRLLAAGGRVLAVTALGVDVTEAQRRAYAAIGAIDWPDGFCRNDIGWRAVHG